MHLNATLKALTVGLGVYVALAAVAADSPHTRGSLVSVLPSPVPAALADTSGTRLKAAYIAGADGSKLFDANAMYDSQLSVECTFHIASDGNSRCLPVLSPSSLQNGVYFLDGSCTQPVTFLSTPPSGCSVYVPKYVWNYKAAAVCPYTPGSEPVRVFSVGSYQGSVSKVWYQTPGGSCLGATTPSGLTYAMTELPASDFVQGTAGTDP